MSIMDLSLANHVHLKMIFFLFLYFDFDFVFVQIIINIIIFSSKFCFTSDLILMHLGELILGFIFINPQLITFI